MPEDAATAAAAVPTKSAARLAAFSRFVTKKVVDATGTPETGTEVAPPENSSPVEAGSTSEDESVTTINGLRDRGDAGEKRVGGDRSSARAIIERIGRQFVKLRESGRSQAWADLENELMLNASTLIDQGMISAKEWMSMAIEIEGFRKSEAGTQQLPGDFLAKWLSDSEDDSKKVVKQ